MKKKILISQVYYNGEIHQYLKKNHHLIEALYIDSGGYTWYRSGFKAPYEKYFNNYLKKINKIRELQQFFKVYFIQLDKPTHPKETKDLWQLQKNIPDFYPVFTIGSDLNYLKELATANELIFLGAISGKSSESIYNYLEPSMFELKFSDILKNAKAKIHLLGKTYFEYKLDYITSMDSCLFNGAHRNPRINKIYGYLLKKYGSSYLAKIGVNKAIYLEREPRTTRGLVHACVVVNQLKVILDHYTEEEQVVINDVISNINNFAKIVESKEWLQNYSLF